MLNLFPYNPGHLLICPYRHVPRYLDLTDEETLEFTALTKDAVRAVEAAGGRVVLPEVQTQPDDAQKAE